MSDINLNNYEAYLLDFMEGNLSAEDARSLQAFLESHPEIDADIFDPESVKLKPENVSFDNKLSLQRDEDIPELSKQDTILIGLLENNLTNEEKQTAEALIRENASAAHDFDLYKKTKFTANTGITYKNKETLKKKSRVIPVNFGKYAAVAAVFVGIMVTVFLNIDTQTNFTELPDQISSVESVIHFDTEANTEAETNISASEAREKSNNSHIAMLHTEAEINTAEPTINNNNEPLPVKAYTPVQIDHIPLKKASKVDPGINHQNTEITWKKPQKEKLNWKDMNITYIKETPMANNSQELKFPTSLDELDETLEELDKKYNPIIKLREAKEELLATNVNDLFKRQKGE